MTPTPEVAALMERLRAKTVFYNQDGDGCGAALPPAINIEAAAAIESLARDLAETERELEMRRKQVKHFLDHAAEDVLATIGMEPARTAALRERAEKAEAALAMERQRCVDIVQAARFGEVDRDFRAIVSMIEGGLSVEQLKDGAA